MAFEDLAHGDALGAGPAPALSRRPPELDCDLVRAQTRWRNAISLHAPANPGRAGSEQLQHPQVTAAFGYHPRRVGIIAELNRQSHTFNRDNVTLVDTQGRGVEAISAAGVVVAGAQHSIDCLIFATGFEVGTDYSRRTGFEIIGREGLTLTDKWRDGVRTVHGLSVHGFPNCFILSIAQSGFTVNFPYLLDVQARHAAWVIAWALRNDAIEIEATPEAETAWVETVVARSSASAGRAKSCTPGYYNREGQANAKTRQGSFFYGSPTEYADILEASRAAATPEGFEVR